MAGISEQEFLERIQRPSQAELTTTFGSVAESFSSIDAELEAIRTREEQPIISGASGLEKFFDVINTPQQFLFGLLNKRPEEGLLEAGVRGTRANLRFADILQQQGIKGPASEFLGFAGDIFFDPAILLAGPIFKGLGIGVKAASRFGIRAAKAALGPTISNRLFESAVKPLARKFSKTAFATGGEAEFFKITDRALTEFQNAKQTIVIEAAAGREIAEQIAKRTGRDLEEILPLVTKRIEDKTRAQLAFPFATRKEAEKIVGHPQVPLFVSNSIDDEFKLIKAAESSADLEKTIGKLPDDEIRDIAHLATTEKQRLENVILKERSFLVKTERLEDSTVDYLTHLITPEAKKVFTGLPEFRGFGRQFSGKHAFQLQRKLNENHPAIRAIVAAGGPADVANINKLWREGKLFPKLGQQSSNLFIDDPFAASAVRRIRGEKAIADAKIILKSAANPRVALPAGTEPAGAGWRALQLGEDTRLSALSAATRNLRFEPEVATHLEAMLKHTTLPEGVDGFLKVFDQVQGMWKALTLSLFPSYHLRNRVGDVWNNVLAGMSVSDIKFYKMARDVQMGKLPTVTLGGKPFAVDEIVNLSKDLGVTGRGFQAGEVSRKSLKAIQGGQITAEELPIIGRGVKFGFDIGSKLEDNGRLAHFLWRLDKGDDAVDAAISTKKYLFDYVNGLTEFEQSVMRRVMPFYAWSRFNIPLQARAIVDNPRPFVRLSELVQTFRTKGVPGVSGGPDFEKRTAAIRKDEREILPNFIQEAVGIPIRLAEDGNPEYALLGGWIPAADLEVLFRKDGLVERVKDLLSPFLKEPVEQAFNFNSFLDRKIEEFPGEKTKFLGISTRRRYAKVLRNLRILSEADRIIRTATDERAGFTEDQTTAAGNIARAVFGLKTFKVSPSRQERDIARTRRDLRSRLKRAIRRKDTANIKTLRELIKSGKRLEK